MKWRPQLYGLAAVAFVVAVFGACSSDSTEPVHFVDQNWTSADIVLGGKLYDKWWVTNSGTEPTTDFNPIWATQSTNTRTGGDTWRCKECHGWDYLGDEGRYASGSHFTGFAGVWTARTMDSVLLFESIKDAGGDHDLSGVLSDTDVLNLTKFIVDGLVDMRTYIDFSTGDATGNATAGQSLYDANCTACHGSDGDAVDLDHGGTEPGIQGVGWISRDNPQETLHKIRWGHPGTAMPSMVDEGLTDTQIGDILAYAQTLPFGAGDYGQADIVRGGKLYDKWWAVNGATEPTTDFDPIWASQSTNTRTGSATWRCKECHGWDYLGKDGRYATGSHFTGFAGVWDARTNAEVLLFSAIKDETGDHDLSGVLSDADVLDLVKFIRDGLVDMRNYIDFSTGNATGTAATGQPLYASNCASCHGSNGLTIDFDDATAGVQGVGWLSRDNPQETLHKIRWGHPGTAMPSMVDQGLTDQQTGDILAHAQTLP